MKRLLVASALMFAMSGIANSDDRWKDRKEYEKDRREAIREAEKDRREAEREYWKDRREAEREAAKDRREAYKEYAKARREWARGQYIPREYLVDRYYIRDYDDYGLAPPPRGYAYVRPYPQDDRYYLVQLATGVISQILGR
jgi:Ni/Co efflux regulator RcnB